jgi:hypothetical protein
LAAFDLASFTNEDLAKLHREVVAEASRRNLDLFQPEPLWTNAIGFIQKISGMTVEQLETMDVRRLSLDEQNSLKMLLEHRKIERARCGRSPE